MKKSSQLLIMFLSSVFSVVQGQVSVTDGNLTYAQDFDSSDIESDFIIAGTGSPLIWNGSGGAGETANSQWQNNSTFGGWYRQVSSGGFTDRTDKDFLGEMASGTVRFGSAGNGGSFPEAVGADTSLGILMENTGNQASFGAIFANNTSGDLVSASVSYTGEQWFRGDAGRLEFQYKVINNPTGFLINDGIGWNDFDTLDFASIANGGNLKRNGNFSGFQTNFVNQEISFTATNSQYLAVRWQYTSTTSGAQAGLFVDDFSVSFTPVPEPSSYALLAGFLGLGAVMIRRRR